MNPASYRTDKKNLSMEFPSPFSTTVNDELAITVNPNLDLTGILSVAGLPGETSPLDHHHQFSPASVDCQLEREASLLMFYLDHIFQIQFPFYRPSLREGGRTWLLSLLTSTKPVYYATLSVAALYWSITIEQHDSNNKEQSHTLHAESDRHRSTALEELRVFIDKSNVYGMAEKLKASVSALACIMQLLFFECAANRIGHWIVYARTASSLLPDVLKMYESRVSVQNSGYSKSSYSLGTPLSTADRMDNDCLSPENEAALRFTANVFAWIDTVSCTSLDFHPISFDHRRLFEFPNSGMQQHMFFGCRNWAVSFLSESIELAHWKREKGTQNGFRIRELVSRAMDIEKRLEQRITEELHSHRDVAERMGLLFGNIAMPTNTTATVGSQWNNGGTSGNGNGNGEATTFYVTYVFAIATLLHLHVTVDGFNLDTPEIRNSVSRAVMAFKFLPDLGLMRYLTFPMLIAGCMADQELQQREIFRDLAIRVTALGGLDVEHHLASNGCRAVIQTLERVWQGIQENTFEAADWITVTGLLGQPICLLG
ncbi:hypothetical protein A7D00_0272 [Trichophyton violaceum]|uniref:Uncharacterized protein n=1 Tax=Trichophyton violaceum TaxID=34388 RepID=A0A178FRF6_TRIVO|nr:hypothetical protein A7D00_0272 [Trichophyton violaceum]